MKKSFAFATLILTLSFQVKSNDSIITIDNNVEQVSYEADYAKPLITLIEDIRDDLINIETSSREDFQAYIRFSEISSSLYRSCKPYDEQCVVESALLVTPLIKELFSKERNNCSSDVTQNYLDQIESLQIDLNQTQTDNLAISQENESLINDNQSLNNELSNALARVTELENLMVTQTVSCNCSAKFLGNYTNNFGAYFGSGKSEGLALQEASRKCRQAIVSYSQARSNQVRSGIYSYSNVKCEKI